MKEISVYFLVFHRKIIKFAQYAIEMKPQQNGKGKRLQSVKSGSR